MINLRKIALGTVAIAAVIALFATGPEVAQVWSQVANADELHIYQDFPAKIHAEPIPPLEYVTHHQR
jgi:hypothetical protein